MQRLTVLKTASSQLLVLPYKRVSFDQGYDVLILKFIRVDKTEHNKIQKNQIILSSQDENYKLLGKEELKIFAAQEEGYDSSLDTGFQIGTSYNRGKLLKYYSDKRLVEAEKVRRPSSDVDEYYYEFFLVPNKATLKNIKLKYVTADQAQEIAIDLIPTSL